MCILYIYRYISREEEGEDIVFHGLILLLPVLSPSAVHEDSTKSTSSINAIIPSELPVNFTTNSSLYFLSFFRDISWRIWNKNQGAAAMQDRKPTLNAYPVKSRQILISMSAV